MIMMSHLRPAWRKSSYSNGEASCVEVAAAARTVAVRDSKDPHGPRLAVPAGSWAAFTQRVRQGDAGRLQRQQGAHRRPAVRPFAVRESLTQTSSELHAAGQGAVDDGVVAVRHPPAVAGLRLEIALRATSSGPASTRRNALMGAGTLG